ncbi:MAG: hypothetical protein N2Z80_02730 [Hydrogenothermaceae bacterium]|nr:hypothetical protein [Hydrogenothermaceae bacterium]
MNIDLKSVYKEVNIKFLIIEIMIFILIIYVIGSFINKEDPLFLNSELNFLFHLLPLSIMTLFYGMFAGLVYFSLFSGVSLLIYGSLNHTYYLSLLLFLLIFSEFWFYWDKRLKEYRERYIYADEKLRDMARNLLLVKLSHDQLERFYVTKPISIRKLIFDIRKDILSNKDKDEVLKRVFDLVVANFNLEKAGLFELDEKNNLIHRLNTGGLTEADKDDSLVKYAIEDQNITYITEIVKEEFTKYICVIPFSENSEVKYLLVIEKMPFLNLNLDTLLSINLIVEYVLKEFSDLKMIERIYKRFREFGVEFLKEVERMNYMYNKFRIESTVVYMYVNDVEETVPDMVIGNTRGLDVSTKLEFTSQNFQGIAILLPFTDLYGANMFIKRVFDILSERFSREYVEKNIKYKVFKISKPEKLLLEFYSFEGF